MNMYEFSEKNNREMGILINRKEDSELYFDVCREAKSILAASQRCDSQGQPLTSVDKTISVTKPEPINNSVLSDKAFCIRCHGDITFNLHRPLCAKCYVAWVKTKNRRHPEKYCHQCGLEVKTSLVKPICKQCFVMSKK
ncbi:hypothetical protein FLX56_03880 [Synechococcus moorigangaii CMS01]|nr:hypothetical protein [Synechococcus moorigangaii CMS01]